jgi:hypothetical protein
LFWAAFAAAGFHVGRAMGCRPSVFTIDALLVIQQRVVSSCGDHGNSASTESSAATKVILFVLEHILLNQE